MQWFYFIPLGGSFFSRSTGSMDLPEHIIVRFHLDSNPHSPRSPCKFLQEFRAIQLPCMPCIFLHACACRCAVQLSLWLPSTHTKAIHILFLAECKRWRIPPFARLAVVSSSPSPHQDAIIIRSHPRMIKCQAAPIFRTDYMRVDPEKGMQTLSSWYIVPLKIWLCAF